jgi:hypothetical protein
MTARSYKTAAWLLGVSCSVLFGLYWVLVVWLILDVSFWHTCGNREKVITNTIMSLVFVALSFGLVVGIKRALKSEITFQEIVQEAR